MGFSIRDARADLLARELAQIEKTSVPEAVLMALEEALLRRHERDSPAATARDILARRGIVPSASARLPLSREDMNFMHERSADDS
jgi:antitoxin VapB